MTICIYCVNVITIDNNGEWIHADTKQSWCQLIKATPEQDNETNLQRSTQ
jgi:hypothetical protein